MKIFAPAASRPLATQLARFDGFELGAVEEREFGDGEFKIRPLEDVRGQPVIAYHSLFAEPGASVSDKLARILFLVGALKDAGADEVTAIVPYLAFARKDRRTQPGDPITTRYVAQLFEAMGTDACVTADVHNTAAFENAFRIATRHVTAAGIFARHVAARSASRRHVVVSPDAGGMKRAHAFAALLAAELDTPVPIAFVEKYRSLGRVTGSLFAGDVRDADVLIVDDMIASGGTVARAAEACRAHGAGSLHALATHAVLSADAVETLGAAGLDSVVVTDTVDPDRTLFGGRQTELVVLESAGLFAA